MSRYAIGGGRAGKERLNLMSRVLLPTTSQLLNRAGIEKGMTCLDVGCGGGNVTRLLASLVGPQGKVVGLDMDGEILALAQQDAEAERLSNLEFRQADVADFMDEGVYDLVYARFLLSHLPEPLECLKAMARACKPAGVIVVEEIDFSGNFCYPHCAAYQRYGELYEQVIRRRGGDANLGQKLPGMLRQTGASGIQIHIVQAAHTEGEGKLMASITLARIAESVLSEGLATEDEVGQVIEGLNEAVADSQTLMSLPRIFQVFGRRA
jgi:ubiquinone/menaquinone biosynthesis C-methylase UbiE